MNQGSFYNNGAKISEYDCTELNSETITQAHCVITKYQKLDNRNE